MNAYYGIMLYEGLNTKYYFHNAKPYTNYQFELIAMINEEKQTILDTKTLSFLTLNEGYLI